MNSRVRPTIKTAAACLSAAATIMLPASSARAQIAVDGNLDAAYGAPLAVQTVNTGFGNSTGGDSVGGSELDAAYGVIQGGNLYLFLAGNLENNGNHLNVFVAGGAPGQSTLSLPNTGSMQNMNGSVFSPGFQATYAYDVNDYQGTLYNEEYIYGGSPGSLAGGYVGSLAESSTGMAAGSFGGHATIGLNNTHVSTMGAPGAAANQSAAASVNTGFEMAIPLSVIGYTGGSIEVLADVNGNPDNYLSNQFLPGLPVGSGDLGQNGVFNFGATPGEFFVVAVPEPASAALLGLGLAGAVCLRRRK
jgi:hypothetical protein